MNGDNILIDTNIALYLLFGDNFIAEILHHKNVFVSFVTELELLGYSGLQKEDLEKIEDFLHDCIIIDLNENIKQNTVRLKQQHKIKLPDALIAATSIYLNIPLFSADTGFEKIKQIQFIRYEK